MFDIFKLNPDTGEKRRLTFKEFVFPAGEVSVKINANDHYYRDMECPQTILARIQCSDDLMKLAMLKDALERFDPQPIHLFLPYVPYGRQDRVCDKGESFSLKVFGRFINSLNFASVTVLDPHSNVTEGVIDRVKVLTQLDAINKNLDLIKMVLQIRPALVSPDAGANKKTADIAEYFSYSEFIRADKLRDLSTGAIKEIVVYCDDLKGQDVVILDDLCERGGTFIGLAKALKAKNCGKIRLYVTHGVFAGEDKDTVLTNLTLGGIDEIWTTNSYRTDLYEFKGLTLNVLDVEERFLS